MKLIQSYVWHGERVFMVSTIDRESSAMGYGPMVYAETMVWECEQHSPHNRRPEILWQGEDCRGSIACHMSVCKHLFETGKPEEVQGE